MDWFDCIETPSVNTESVSVRWSTETIERERLFFETFWGVKKACRINRLLGYEADLGFGSVPEVRRIIF